MKIYFKSFSNFLLENEKSTINIDIVDELENYLLTKTPWVRKATYIEVLTWVIDSIFNNRIWCKNFKDIIDGTFTDKFTNIKHTSKILIISPQERPKNGDLYAMENYKLNLPEYESIARYVVKNLEKYEHLLIPPPDDDTNEFSKLIPIKPIKNINVMVLKIGNKVAFWKNDRGNIQTNNIDLSKITLNKIDSFGEDIGVTPMSISSFIKGYLNYTPILNTNTYIQNVKEFIDDFKLGKVSLDKFIEVYCGIEKSKNNDTTPIDEKYRKEIRKKIGL